MKANRIFSWLLTVILTALIITPISAAGECTEVYGKGGNSFSLATGSPGELGLLKVLAEAFDKENDARLCWVKAGSGASLKLLREKKVDMIMVHAPAAEKQAVEQGWAIKRTLIGSNEFYIVGPAADPAGIGQAKSAADAYTRIAQSKAKFLSRGDNSGTNKKEMAVWKNAGINPSGDWYIVTKDFMMATLKKADEIGGYFMTDSSTWVAAKKEMTNLTVLFRGDPFLINTYHALCQPDAATAGQATAAEFVDFVASPKGQQIIDEQGDRIFKG